MFTDSVAEAAVAGDLMARRRVEDERFAYFAEAAIVFLDLPAVFRGYRMTISCSGALADDEPPFDVLRREIERLNRSASTSRSASGPWTTSCHGPSECSSSA